MWYTKTSLCSNDQDIFICITVPQACTTAPVVKVRKGFAEPNGVVDILAIKHFDFALWGLGMRIEQA